jgi:integrase
MASSEKRTRNGQVRWIARYRDPEGNSRAKSFTRKVDADKFLVTVEASKLRGAYVDVREASRTFRDVAEQHWAGYAHTLAADSTRLRKRSVLDRHILPALGDHPIGSIRPSTVNAAVATWSASLAPGTVGQVLRQVRQILDSAVLDGIIPANVAKDAKAPAAPRRRNVHLSDDDITAALAVAPAAYRPLVIALIGLGLRISEACGLRVEDVDFLRQTVRVRQQRRPSGQMGVLKTASSSRDIPAVPVVLEALAEQIRRWPREDGLIFSSSTGRPMTKAIGGHVFDAISKAGGVKLSPHSVRHYFGSSLISAGVSVVAVSSWLGHSSPDITYRVYSYLMASDQEVGRSAMTTTLSRVVPDVYPVCNSEAPSAL